MLPPCQSALYEKVRRTNCMATIYTRAMLPRSVENGWVLVDGSNKKKWFERDTVPQDV